MRDGKALEEYATEAGTPPTIKGMMWAKERMKIQVRHNVCT
jgi:hypothetical protein